MKTVTGVRLFLLVVFAAAQIVFYCLPADARFPFSLSKQELKTDYSQTVWDRIMIEQSAGDMKRGMTEMSAARYQDASNSFARAVIKNSKDPLPYLLLGASLYWAGKVDEAVSEYKEGLSKDPSNALAYQLLGIAAGWKGDIQAAQDYFLQANRLDPNKADTNMNLASTYAAQRDWDNALIHFRRATELAPHDPLYHYQLGTLYESLGRDEQAEAELKKSLKYFSNYEDAQLSLGALYEKQNRAQDALKMYKRAVKTKPGDFVARLRYALLLMQQNDPARAREIIEQAFSISRFKAEGLALNAVYRASGHTAQAFEEQIRQFKENLERVSSAKPINIEVAMTFDPIQNEPKTSSKSGDSFEKAYQRLHPRTVQSEGESSQTFKRIFTLQATDAETRHAQIEELAEQLQQAVKQGADKYNVSLSMQGRTPDYNAPSALTQNRTSSPKAVYDPRIVGNDMGLWVVGRMWTVFVDEAIEMLQEYPSCSTDSLCTLLNGLAFLAQGNAQAASRQFENSVAQNPSDALGWLGLGTAAVIDGNDEQARVYYQRVLEAAPTNKTAAKNLKVLED